MYEVYHNMGIVLDAEAFIAVNRNTGVRAYGPTKLDAIRNLVDKEDGSHA